MKKGYNFEKPVPITGIGFSWLTYKNEDFLSKGHFTLEQWHKIIYDIDDMVQWGEFLERYKKFCTCYVLYPSHETEPIAMCYLLAEDGLYEEYGYGEVVSVHGGGWKKDMRSQYLYARAWISLVHHLHLSGCKVLTNVKNDNVKAKHLVEGTGFRLNEMDLYEYHPEYNKFQYLISTSPEKEFGK